MATKGSRVDFMFLGTPRGPGSTTVVTDCSKIYWSLKFNSKAIQLICFSFISIAFISEEITESIPLERKLSLKNQRLEQPNKPQTKPCQWRRQLPSTALDIYF